MRSLRAEADGLLAQGMSAEDVATLMIARRNSLKRIIRADDPPAAVIQMEARNRRKYGDPLGPDKSWCLARYGSWEAVIDASCRHAAVRNGFLKDGG